MEDNNKGVHQEQTIRKAIKPNQQKQQQLSFNSIFTKQQQCKLLSALNTASNYHKVASLYIQQQQNSIKCLSKDYLDMNPQLKSRISGIMEGIFQNQLILTRGVGCFRQYYKIGFHEIKQSIAPSRIINLLHLMVRQWSKQSLNERLYMVKIIQLIKQNINLPERMLVIGSGLGRILLQLRLSFQDTQIMGYEQNPQLFIFGQYFLNYVTTNQKLLPNLHNFTNNLTTLFPYQIYNIPDVINIDKSLCGNFGSFISMHQNKFLHQQHKWNVIITNLICQEINNILQYIQTIYYCLQQNGIWIDFSNGCFQSHIIPLTYQQYDKIINNSQFITLSLVHQIQKYFYNPNNLMYEQKKVYYRVMKKK